MYEILRAPSPAIESARSPAVPAGAAIARAGSALLPPLAILAAMAAGVALAGKGWWFARPLWLDEFHTLLVAADPDLGHSLSALRRGADFNPPGLFLALRAYAAVVGPLTEASLRGFAFASAYVALLGVYALLRACFRPSVALAGALATWSHPLLIQAAFDGRFYAPWLAALAWLCVALGRVEASPRRAGAIALVAGLSAFVCSVHYFGIIALTLAGAAHLAASGRRPGQVWPACLGLAAGPLVLAALAAIFYSGQRASISVPTWIAPTNYHEARNFLTALIPAGPFALAGVLAAVAVLARRVTARAGASGPDGPPIGPLAPALGLALMPAAIVALSYLLQPSTVGRYAIPAVLCVGPIVATLLDRARLGVVLAGCAGFVALAALDLKATPDSPAGYDGRDALAAIAAVAGQHPEGGPALVLSDRRGLAYQCWRYAPALRDRVRLLDRSDDLQGQDRTFHRLERDVAARLHQLYATPGPATAAEASAAVPVLYLLTLPDDAEALAAYFPNHRRRDLHQGRVVALELTAIPPP